MRVLVVDDDPVVCAVLRKLLERLGHRAVAERDPRVAVRRFGGGEDRFDLVVMDVRMPGMSGAECLEALRAVDGGVPVVVSSGHRDGRVQRLLDAGAAGFLRKPYTLDDLERAIADVGSSVT